MHDRRDMIHSKAVEIFLLLLLTPSCVTAAGWQEGNRNNSSTGSLDSWNGLEQLQAQLPTFHLFDYDLNPAFLPQWTYPIERGICGNWMQPYAQLHRDILQGRRPPRYTIFR
jgi:hypothetical protein